LPNSPGDRRNGEFGNSRSQERLFRTSPRLDKGAGVWHPSARMSELPKAYEPQAVEEKWYAAWIEEKCFEADPSSEKEGYSIVIPPPNVTGILHLGHVLNNTLQDVLARRARQQGKEVLWLPGTDHAGIATQTIVERMLKKNEGKTRYEVERTGMNGRLDTLQAAVLLAKLPHLAEWSRARAAHARRYSEAFAAHPVICPPKVDPLNEHIFHQYTIRVPRRDELQAALKAKGIGNAVYYPLPLHLQPCFAHLGYQRGALPVSEAAAASVISLPIYPELAREQQDAVIDAVLGFYV